MKNLIKQSLVTAVFLLGSLGLMAQDNGEVAKMLQNDKKKEQVFNRIMEDPGLREEMMQRMMENCKKDSSSCNMMGDMMMEDNEMQGMMMGKMMDKAEKDPAMCKKMCKMMMGNEKMMNMMENMKGKSDNNDQMEGMKGMNMKKQENKSAPVDFEGEPVFLVSYVDIKNALVNDNYEEVKKGASKMKKDLGNSELNRQHRNEIAASLDRLAQSKDIKTQRQHFAQLSQQLYQVVKGKDFSDKTLYWQHCPMALGKGANWLSYQEQVRNPYMGQKMPGCGSVEEKIEN